MTDGMAFAGAPLERAPDERRDPAWLEEQRASSQAAALALSEEGLWVEDGRLVLSPPGP